MPGPNVGYATLSIIPSMRGVGRGLGAPLQDELDPVGTRAGGSFMDKFGAKARLAAAGAAVAIGAVLVTGITAALDNERATDRMAASLGLDPATQERVARVAGDVFAGAYGDSMDQVAAAAGSVFADLEGQLGGLSLQGATEQALDLASAFEIDVQRAISTAGNLIESGLARDADHAFDLLTAGLQEMPVALRDELLEASDEYGRFFSGLGISAEETFGLLTTAAQGGVYGIDKTGDALKELSIRATDMSATSVAAYGAAGLGAEDMSARFLAGGDTARGAMDDLVAGLLSIEDPTEQANAAIALFGTPLEDLGTTGIPTFLEDLAAMGGGLDDVGGAAEAMGETLNDNAATKIESFKRRALQGLTNVIGDYLIPAMERLGDIFGDVFDFVSRNEDVFTALGIGLGAVALIIGIGLVPAFLAWAAAALVAAAGTLLALAPLILIGLAVALLAYIIIRNWDTIKAATTAVWNAIGGALSAVWEGIKTGVGAALGWIREKWDGLVSFVTGLPGRIRSAASGIWDGISEGIRGAINAIIDAWNRLDFGIDISVPSWVPGVGGRGFQIDDIIPDIPRLERGAVVRATPGGILANIGEGRWDEAVVPLDGNDGPFGGTTIIEFRAGDRHLLAWLRSAVRVQGGGNVQVALGKAGAA